MQIKSKLPINDLEVIYSKGAADNSIKWVKAAKEFVFHGQMYDIVRTIRESTGIYYYCIRDVKEKKLFEKLNEIVNNSLSKNPKAKVIQKLSLSAFIIPDRLKTYLVFKTYLFYTQLKKYTPPAISQITPPPKIFVNNLIFRLF